MDSDEPTSPLFEEERIQPLGEFIETLEPDSDLATGGSAESGQPQVTSTDLGEPQGPPESPITLNVGDVRPQPLTEPRHLWLQELVRASYALILVLVLAGTVIGAFIGANGPNWASVKELLQLLLPAETALLGSAAGFDFGSRRH